MKENEAKYWEGHRAGNEAGKHDSAHVGATADKAEVRHPSPHFRRGFRDGYIAWVR